MYVCMYGWMCIYVFFVCLIFVCMLLSVCVRALCGGGKGVITRRAAFLCKRCTFMQTYDTCGCCVILAMSIW